LNHREFTQIGNRIQKGPSSLYKKPRTGNEYLLDLFSLHFSCKEFKTYQVFCDAEGSEEVGYFPTIIRTAYWNRSQDRKRDKLIWPDIKINFFKFSSYTQPLQDLVCEIQKKLDKPLISQYGLPELRNFGELKDCGIGRLAIKSHIGSQILQREFYLSEGQVFSKVFDEFDSLIKDHGTNEPQENWFERYENDWPTFVNSKSSYWDGKPETI